MWLVTVAIIIIWTKTLQFTRQWKARGSDSRTIFWREKKSSKVGVLQRWQGDGPTAHGTEDPDNWDTVFKRNNLSLLTTCVPIDVTESVPLERTDDRRDPLKLDTKSLFLPHHSGLQSFLTDSLPVTTSARFPRVGCWKGKLMQREERKPYKSLLCLVLMVKYKTRPTQQLFAAGARCCRCWRGTTRTTRVGRRVATHRLLLWICFVLDRVTGLLSSSNGSGAVAHQQLFPRSESLTDSCKDLWETSSLLYVDIQ